MRQQVKQTLAFLAGGVMSGFMLGSLLAVSVPQGVSAANNSTLNQTINAGVLSTDILDNALAPVGAPSIAMSSKNLAFTCQSGGSASTGIFGSNAQRIYVMNPGGANNGWTLTLAATSGATAVWTSGGNTFDFNDSGTSGCSDGGDADTRAGQLTVDPSVGTLTADCVACSTTSVSKGSSASFVQGTTDSITLLNAALASDDVWRGYLTGTALSQTIPAETPAGTYTVNMTLTATAL